MTKIALLAIRLYQRFLSPYKGFACAYRVHTGHASCSALGYRAIRRLGLWHGLGVLHKRLDKCGVAHRRYRHLPRMAHRQAGFCDLPCDVPADCSCAPSCRCDPVATGWDVLGNCTSPCDCGHLWSSRKDGGDDEPVHIPPSIHSSSKEPKP